MANLDWSRCPAVESIPGKRGGAWVFRDTRTPVSVVFDNREAGATVGELMDWFHVTREQVAAVLEFAARSLDAPSVEVRRTFALMLVVGLMATAAAYGQTAAHLQSEGSPQGLTFEAASVKPDRLQSDGMIGGTFRINGIDGRFMTVKSFIQTAYSMRWEDIIGPAWLNDDSPTYSITANASRAVSEPTVRIMLQNLLAERFKLKVHTEMREQGVFALILEKRGVKAQPVQYEEADADRCVRPISTGMEAHHCSMAAFAKGLSGGFFSLGRPVIDMTGLSGRFDFTLRYETRGSTGLAPMLYGSDGAIGPTLFDAVQEIGLKLEPRKAPVAVLVVDQVNKTPTEN